MMVDATRTIVEHIEASSRIAVLEAEVKNIEQTTNRIQADQRENFKQMHDKLEKISNRVEEIERWKWTVIGGAAVLGYLLSNITKFIGSS